jgi:hypothetical protein
LFLKEYDDECPNGPHHRAELEKAFREYNGSEAVRSLIDVRPSGAKYTSLAKTGRRCHPS